MFACLESRFTNHLQELKMALAAFEQRLDGDETPHDDAALAELAQVLNASLEFCLSIEMEVAAEPQQLKALQARYREAIAPWFAKSWFMTRSLTKPRGYPGDYELLNSIYIHQPKSTGLGGYLDRYILSSTLGRAVIARLESVREFLVQEVAARGGKAKIMNVACGPGREYRDGFLDAEAVDVHITLVDNDTESLDYVRDHVAPLLSSRVDMQFVRYNALRMISGKTNVQRFGQSDIIYSVGLCDYIPDDYLVPMLRGWRESLAEGGVVYVAFKDMELYDKTVYQWPLDWYFYQRTVEDCRRLFVEAGYDMDLMEVTRSEMPVIVNFIGRTRPASVHRIDEANKVVAQPHVSPVRESMSASGS
jgi:SAM-dependent methyltransferase